MLIFFGLSPKLGPIAEWGLDIERGGRFIAKHQLWFSGKRDRYGDTLPEPT